MTKLKLLDPSSAFNLERFNEIINKELDRCNPSETAIKLLSRAIAEDNPHILAEYLSATNGFDINQRLIFSNGVLNKTLLQWAVYWRSDKLVKILMDMGTDPDVEDNNGFTALHHAVARKSIESIKILLDAGADANRTDMHQRTPCHYAAERGYSSIVSLLCDHPGLDLSVADQNQNTALYLASMHNHVECVQGLLEAGADVNDRRSEFVWKLSKYVYNIKYQWVMS